MKIRTQNQLFICVQSLCALLELNKATFKMVLKFYKGKLKKTTSNLI